MMSRAHDVLGVSTDATEEQIRTAYLQMAKRYHPDKHQGNDLRDLAEARFKQVQAAYEELRSGGSVGASTSEHETSSPPWEAELAQVESLLAREEFTEALRIVDGLLRTAGPAATLHDARGWALIGLERNAEATIAFGASITLDPNSASPLIGLVTTSIEDGDFDAAHRCATKAVSCASSPEELAWAQDVLETTSAVRDAQSTKNEPNEQFGCANGVGCLFLLFVFGGAAIAKFRGPSGPIIIIAMLLAFGPLVKVAMKAFRDAVQP